MAWASQLPPGYSIEIVRSSVTVDFIVTILRILDVVLLTLWHIWKVRNTAIFDHHTMTGTEVLHRIISDMDSWSCRYKKLIADWTAWRNYYNNWPRPPAASNDSSSRFLQQQQ
nr:unnamed protein product [Digitaria exilis]